MAFPDVPEMRQMGAKIYRNTIDFPDGLAVMQSGWGIVAVVPALLLYSILFILYQAVRPVTVFTESFNLAGSGQITENAVCSRR